MSPTEVQTFKISSKTWIPDIPWYPLPPESLEIGWRCWSCRSAGRAQTTWLNGKDPRRSASRVLHFDSSTGSATNQLLVISGDPWNPMNWFQNVTLLNSLASDDGMRTYQLILVTEILLSVWKFRVPKWETNARGLVLKILKAYKILWIYIAIHCLIKLTRLLSLCLVDFPRFFSPSLCRWRAPSCWQSWLRQTSQVWGRQRVATCLYRFQRVQFWAAICLKNRARTVKMEG